VVKKAMAEGKALFTEPYRDATRSEMMTIVLAPVSSGSNGGVAGVDISLIYIKKMLSTTTLAVTAGVANTANNESRASLEIVDQFRNAVNAMNAPKAVSNVSLEKAQDAIDAFNHISLLLRP
jgi:hypothetical protein